MREAYLTLLAASLIVVLRHRVAGAWPYALQLDDEDVEFCFRFALSHPKVATRYHNPNTNKVEWLQELEDTLDV